MIVHILFAALVYLSGSTKKLAFNQKGYKKSTYSKLSSKNMNKYNNLPNHSFKLTKPADEPSDDFPNKIYVCEGDTCNGCEGNESLGIDIQLTKYSLLDETLANSDLTDVEIIICGSTRQNHPNLKISNVFDKLIKLQGHDENQFITLIRTPSTEEDYEEILELISDNVTIIINEAKDSEDLIFSYAELKNSPVEVNNLVFLSGESDFISLSSVRTKLYTVSLKILDALVSKIKIGINFITFYQNDQNTNSLSLHEYDMPMDIWLSLNHNKVDLVADTSIQKKGTENNIVVDFEIGIDKKATASFDSTWNSLKKVNFVQIKHNCDLEIISDKKSIALGIEVFGSGNVTRTGTIDDGDDDDTTVTISSSSSSSDDSADDGQNNQKERFVLSTLSICCLVGVILIIIGVIIYVISKKKRRGRGNQDFNDYLNNEKDLDDMNEPL